MADSNSFNNLSQSARESLVDALKKQADDTGNFVDISGDTMTGTLEVPTLNVTSGATITNPTMSGVMNSTGTITQSGVMSVNSTATLVTPLVVGFNTVLGGATIAPLQVISSTASGAFFDFRGAVISTASLNLTGAQMAGIIKVWIDGTGGQNVGYLPIFKGVA